MGQHTYQNRKTSTLRRLCVRPLSRCSVAGAESHRLAGVEGLIADRRVFRSYPVSDYNVGGDLLISDVVYHTSHSWIIVQC